MSTEIPAGDRETCAQASLAADEPLAGTATQALSWLVVESRGAWGRDAVTENALAHDEAQAVAAFAGRVLLVRRPTTRVGPSLVFRAETTDEGGTLTRHPLSDLVAARDPADLGAGETLDGPLVLVCMHGRRDACCARLGRPVFDALAAHTEPGLLWQSSHQGGHRFAANVLVLPAGLQLGRVEVDQVPRVATLIAAGRIPLDLYRGRTAYPARVQAAEVAVRRQLGLDRVAELALAGLGDGDVTFAHADGETTVYVEERPGPVLPVSCGAEPETTTTHIVAFR